MKPLIQSIRWVIVTLVVTLLFFITFPLVSLAKEMGESPRKSSACETFGVQRIQTKKDAPAFSLKNLEGKQVTLNEFSGRPLLIFFWATWCPACKEDIPLLEKFFEKNRGQFEILTVAIDGEKEKRVKSAVKDLRTNLPVLLDKKEAVARTYGVRMVPTAFFINGEGGILGMIVGQRDWCSSEAHSAIQELLKLR